VKKFIVRNVRKHGSKGGFSLLFVGAIFNQVVVVAAPAMFIGLVLCFWCISLQQREEKAREEARKQAAQPQ
jgi:hypothetical protein